MREIAWKAQTRLCARYRRMTAAGKKKTIVIAAIAREMAASVGHRSPGRTGALKMRCASALKIALVARVPLARAPPPD